MTKSYGVGIIGAGWVAGEYVKAFRDHPLTHMVGMYNKTPDKATHLMKTHGVDGKEFSRSMRSSTTSASTSSCTARTPTRGRNTSAGPR